MAWKTILGGVPPSVRDNVVDIGHRDRHDPPRKWMASYKAASEQQEYLAKLQAEFAAWEASEAERTALAKAERTQRAAAIMDATRKLDELHNEILVMAANVGIDIEGRQS